MALKATIFKAELNIADMDRHYYGDHSLTLARHPSESDERMMVRLLAFALNASDTLQFTRGLCADDEPELWQKNLHGDIELWIDLGQPDERRIRKACARAEKVIIYNYQPRSALPWWQQLQSTLSRLENLSIYHLPGDTAAQLASLASRTMQLQCTIQDGEVWFSSNESNITISLDKWQ
jgi:uncharacterized protein YaeQ